MKHIIISLILFISLVTGRAQTAVEITNLQTPALDETSGLLFYNNNLITHTDSGGKAELYEIDVATGAIKRTVKITNATNIDWEDIAQDESYIYIGDIGNNSGDRIDLKIYRISKEDYNNGDIGIRADVISYTYADQTDFTERPLKNNWDAEALISYGNTLLIFTKNWVDNKTKVYSITKTIGKHAAVLVSEYDTKGMITGADISPDERVIYLSGYSISEAPFIYTIRDLPHNSLDIFAGKTSSKIDDIVTFGHQVEGIALYEITPTTNRIYLSNENFRTSLGPVKIKVPSKLMILEVDARKFPSMLPTTTTDFRFRQP